MPASAAAPTSPYISEIHYDNDGTDTGEFVEVELPAGTSSDGLASSSTTATSPAAPYNTLPAVGDRRGRPAWPLRRYPAADPERLARRLRPRRAAAPRSSSCPTRAPSPASDGPAAGMTSTDIGVAEAGTEPAGQSLPATYDAATDALVWRGPAAASRVRSTRPPSAGPPPGDRVRPAGHPPVGEVQGGGDATPLAGEQGDRPRRRRRRPAGAGRLPPPGRRRRRRPGHLRRPLRLQPGTAVNLGDTVAVRGHAGGVRRRPRSPRAPTSRCAPRAPPPTCPPRLPWTCPPATPSASHRGHARRARRPAHRERGVRPDPVRRAHPVARAACSCSPPSWPARARPRPLPCWPPTPAAGSCSTTAQRVA